MDATVVTVVTGAVIVMLQSLTTAAAVVGQIYREGRQHRWEEQARDRLAIQLKGDNQALAAKLASDASTLAAKVSADHATLAAKVSEEQGRAADSRIAMALALTENTTITLGAAAAAKEAYHEANSVNNKIAELQKLGVERLATEAAVSAAARNRRHDDPKEDRP